MIARRRRTLALQAPLALVLTVSCAPAVTYTELGPAAPAKGIADPIPVYFDDTDIPPGFTVAGELRIGDTGFSTGCDLDAVIGIAKDRARKVGADAVYVARVVRPDFSSTCYRITARLLRYPAAAAPESPRPGQAPAVPEDVFWGRPVPNPHDVLFLRPDDLNPSPAADSFERAADAIVRLAGSRGSATGVLITRDGLALTNHHVVENQTRLEATLRDGRRLAVRVLRSDSSTDVALIQIDCERDCFTLDLATATPRIGTEVHVIGNPFALDYTLTRGIISGLRLSGGVTLIQTDAALNPGNSGGPILEAGTGVVLGIVSWKVTGQRAEGLGFGVSVPDALRVLGIQHP
jgi:S1-C subfamily serine protease